MITDPSFLPLMGVDLNETKKDDFYSFNSKSSHDRTVKLKKF